MREGFYVGFVLFSWRTKVWWFWLWFFLFVLVFFSHGQVCTQSQIVGVILDNELCVLHVNKCFRKNDHLWFCKKIQVCQCRPDLFSEQFIVCSMFCSSGFEAKSDCMHGIYAVRGLIGTV